MFPADIARYLSFHFSIAIVDVVELAKNPELVGFGVCDATYRLVSDVAAAYAQAVVNDNRLVDHVTVSLSTFEACQVIADLLLLEPDKRTDTSDHLTDTLLKAVVTCFAEIYYVRNDDYPIQTVID